MNKMFFENGMSALAGCQERESFMVYEEEFSKNAYNTLKMFGAACDDFINFYEETVESFLKDQNCLTREEEEEVLEVYDKDDIVLSIWPEGHDMAVFFIFNKDTKELYNIERMYF